MVTLPSNPKERLHYFKEQVNRLFDYLFEYEKGPLDTPKADIAPSVDVYQREGQVLIEVELPGVTRENLEVSLLDNVLIIEGVKQNDTKGEGKHYLQMERDFGRFHRVFKIPVAVNTSKIRVVFHHGLLTITFPRVEEKRGIVKRIPIEGGC